MHKSRVRERAILKHLGMAQESGGEIAGIKMMLEPIIKACSWDKVLLALSNLCVQFSGIKGKRKHWYKRAKLLHKVMESTRARRKANEEACRIIHEVTNAAELRGTGEPDPKDGRGV